MSNRTTHPLQGINSRRQMLGIKAKDVASALGIRVPSYYRIENGERVCPLPKAITLAHLLECTVEQLGQEPTIEEKIAALHAQEAKHTATPPPSMTDDELRLASGWQPVYDIHDKIIRWMPPKVPNKPVSASPAPVSASPAPVAAPEAATASLSVEEEVEQMMERLRVGEEEAARTLQTTPQQPLMGTSDGIDEHDNTYVDKDEGD